MKNINWDNVEEVKENSRITAGGYVIGIVKAEDVPEREYLRIDFDIAEGEFRGYFKDLKKRLNSETWPYDGQFIRSYKGKAQGFFKAFLSAVEKSNSGYKFANDEKTLRGKLLGVVLREEEYIGNDGSVKSRLRVDTICSADDIRNGNFKVQEPKKLPEEEKPAAAPIVEADDFNEDLPF